MSARTLKNKKLAAALVCMALLVAGCKGNVSPQAVDCDFSDGTCMVDNVRITVNPFPFEPMKETTITISGEALNSPGRTPVTLDFTMPGMNMGINRFDILPQGNGAFMARVVLPRCPRGGRLWRARVLDASQSGITSFSFEVM